MIWEYKPEALGRVYFDSDRCIESNALQCQSCMNIDEAAECKDLSDDEGTGLRNEITTRASKQVRVIKVL